MAKNDMSPARLRSRTRTVRTRTSDASYETRVLAALPKRSAARNCMATRHAVAVATMHYAAQRQA